MHAKVTTTDHLEFDHIKNNQLQEYNQFAQLNHQFDVICEQVESGNYVAKRCGTFLTRFCVFSEQYTKNILSLIEEERAPLRHKKYNGDHMPLFRDLVCSMYSYIETETKKLQRIMLEAQERICEPLYNIVREGDYQYRKITERYRKHKEKEKGLEENAERQRRNCLKLWDGLVNQHQKTESVQKDLVTLDQTKTKSSKLAKMQKNLITQQQKEKKMRASVQDVFANFEKSLSRATIEKKELQALFIPTVISELEALETARMLAMAKCLKDYQQLCKEKLNPPKQEYETFQKLAETAATEKGVKNAIRTWTDKNINTYGFAPQFEPFCSLLPASSEALHNAQWNDEGTNFVVTEDQDGDSLIVEKGAGFLEILENTQLRHWKKRYFKIHDGTLQYFRDFNNDRCLGIVNLHKAMLKRFDDEEFDKEGCWTVTETVAVPPEKIPKRKCGENELDRGPFILSTPKTLREHWIGVLDRHIYNLAVEGLEHMNENQKSTEEKRDPSIKKSSTSSIYPRNALRRRPTASPFHLSSQDHEFKVMKNLLLISTTEDGHSDVIGMILSDDMSEILSLFASISRPNYDKLAKSLIYVAMVLSEAKVCQLLELVAKSEVDRTQSESVLFRIDSLASKMITYYIRESTEPYIDSMLTQCINETILRPSKDGVSFELDPVRLEETLTTKERELLIKWAANYEDPNLAPTIDSITTTSTTTTITPIVVETNCKIEDCHKDIRSSIHRKISSTGISSPELCNELQYASQRVQLLIRQLKNNKMQLEKAAEKILHRIISSVHYAPRHLRALLHYVQKIVNKKFPNNNWSAVSAIFLLRYVCPALSSGSMSRNVARTKLSAKAQRNLLLITKVLQSLANGTEFGYKEKFMYLLRDFVKRETNDFKKFCSQFSDPPYPELCVYSTTDSPNLCQKKVQNVKDCLFTIKAMMDLVKMENSKEWRVTIHYRLQHHVMTTETSKAVIKVDPGSDIKKIVIQAVQKGKNIRVLGSNNDPEDFSLAFPGSSIDISEDKILREIIARDKAEFWLTSNNMTTVEGKKSDFTFPFPRTPQPSRSATSRTLASRSATPRTLAVTRNMPSLKMLTSRKEGSRSIIAPSPPTKLRW